jgi:FAD:protein FMN transferase
MAPWTSAASVAGYWLSLGGDILCSGTDLGGRPWRIGVQDAFDPAKTAASFAARPGELLAVATSGVTKRKGVTRGKAWHHLIDPRSGEPAATDLLTATVTMPTATEADVYAKCLVLVGSAKAQDFAKRAGVQQAVLQIEKRAGVTRISKFGEVL